MENGDSYAIQGPSTSLIIMQIPSDAIIPVAISLLVQVSSYLNQLPDFPSKEMSSLQVALYK